MQPGLTENLLALVPVPPLIKGPELAIAKTLLILKLLFGAWIVFYD